MLRLLLPVIALLALALACNSDEQAPAGTSPGGSATPTAAADAVVICPRIGVPGEATPSSPTPVPSCAPGGNFQTIPGVSTTFSQAPDLPPGSSALTQYIEFAGDDLETPAVIAIPLEAAVPIGRSIAWYTYENGDWRALDTVPTVHQSSFTDASGMAEGSFGSIPASLILLAAP